MKKKTTPKQTNKQNKTKQNKKHKLTSPSRTSVEKKMIPMVIWFGGLRIGLCQLLLLFFLNVMASNNFYFLVFK